MSNNPVTLILEISDPGQQSPEYTLRLLSEGANGLEEKASEKIVKEKLHPSKLEVDPIKTFAEETGKSDDFQEIGEYLFSLLHQGKVKDVWKDFADNNENLRVLLHIKPSELTSLPWELACDVDDRLAMDPSQTFTRKYEPAGPIRKLAPSSWPIRVLIILGATDDDKDVSGLEEIRRIETEIRKYDRQDESNNLIHRVIDIEVLKRPSLAELEKTYKGFKPHVFHFIGHGGLDSNNKAYLVINYFDDKSGKYQPIYWTTGEIANSFKGWKWIPNFVFINACRSNNRVQDYEANNKQAWSIGDAFRRLKVPAVLTMQADINGESAGVFAGAIYKSLAELDPLDTALAHARRALVNHLGSIDRREWAVPVLTIALTPEEILPLSPKAPKELINRIKECEIFQEIEFFSDRKEIRRKLFRGFYPLPPETPNKDVIIVKGNMDSGKSWLAAWCMEACALQNHNIRYVEVGGTESKTWLDLLLQIRDGDENKKSSFLIHERLKESAFYRFDWELEHRFKGVEPPNTWDGTVVPRRKIKLADPGARWTPTFIEDTFKSFCQAIVQAAEVNNPLIIILDHFVKDNGVSKDDMVKYILPYFIEQAAKKELRDVDPAGGVRSVKLILVFREGEFNTFEVKNSISSYYEVSLDSFTPETFIELFAEYIRQLKPEWSEEKYRTTIDGMKILVENAPALSPSDILVFLRYVR